MLPSTYQSSIIRTDDTFSPQFLIKPLVLRGFTVYNYYYHVLLTSWIFGYENMTMRSQFVPSGR